MVVKQTAQKGADIGASKAAKGILGSLDRRLIEPAGTLIRFSGWVMLMCIAYVTTFSVLDEHERRNMFIWLVGYAAYLLILEFLRRLLRELYDSPYFRSIRVAINLVMVSVLVGFASTERHLLIFAYMVPIFAAVVYFAENTWVKFLVFSLALTGLFLGGNLVAGNDRLILSEFLIYSLVLAAFSIVFEIFRRRVYLVPSKLTELARELHKTLDLQQLMSEILKNSVEITQAQRGLIIVINPRNKKYVGHILHNFKLKENCSIDDLAKKCFVLVHGQPFENPDLVGAFNNKSIYHQFFEEQPRSITAEPLFNRAGQVMGVINMAHDDTNGFDKISRNLLKEFAFLVSSAIENCFEHREVMLRQAKSMEASEKFVSADSEDEAIQILIEETRQQISHSEKTTLHKYLPDDDGLVPLHSITPEITPKLFAWSGPIPRGLMPDLKLGYGIAGHALELRDTILVPDTDHHPWFVRLSPEENIKSLLVAPLFDPEGTDCYGTISVESTKPSAFNLDDESTLTYLATQASRAIAKMRDFQVWREEGGTLRQILEQIGSFDLEATEDTLCEQIAEAAARLLGFKIARIRMFSQDQRLITLAMTGVSEKLKQKLIRMDIPYEELKPFLNKSSKAASSYLIKRGTPGWEQFVDKYFHKPHPNKHKKNAWDVYDALVTPLFDSSGKVMGILTLDVPITGSEPSKHILELIGVFANSASWVIELSRTQRRLADQKFRTQSFIDTISQELAKCRDIPTISEVVVQAGAKLLSAEGCSLYLKRGGGIELTNSNYLANTDYIGRRKPISDHPKSGLTAWVAATGKTLRFNNGAHKKHTGWAGEKDHLEHLPSGICRSILITPIKDKDEKVIGVLTLENKKTIAGPKDFDEEDEVRLKSLAGEFARGMEVIGLYEDIKEWERTGIAEDIHDLVNWHHSGIVNWIEALSPWLERGDYRKVDELVRQLRQHALTFVHELKTLHTNFLAKSLEAPTFKQALEETLSVWTNHMTPKYDKQLMRIRFDCPENLEVPIKIRNTMIRFASLAFSNALQHSGIDESPEIEVSLKVEQKQDALTLSVIDNGRGIDREKNPPGFGIDMMKQLVGKINHWGEMQAKFEINTGINKGTKVVLTLTSEQRLQTLSSEVQGVHNE